MKFKVFADIDAPAQITWARFTDFAGLEADARAHGADVERVGHWIDPSEGCGWRGSARIRGRERPVASEITAMARPERYEIITTIGGMNAVYEITFLALRGDMTRAQVVLSLSARTLSARLALQALKMARGRIMERLQGSLSRQGTLAEDDYRRAREGAGAR